VFKVVDGRVYAIGTVPSSKEIKRQVKRENNQWHIYKLNPDEQAFLEIYRKELSAAVGSAVKLIVDLKPKADTEYALLLLAKLALNARKGK
jgi:phage repressor protein C with HTH and peptisase S24 domain